MTKPSLGCETSIERFSGSLLAVMLTMFLLLCSPRVCCGQPTPPPASTPPQETESGDLTKGLVEELLGPSDKLPAKTGSEPNEVDESKNPLAVIRNSMIAAATILMHGDVSSRSVDVQTQILGDLDALIEKIRKETQEDSQKKKSSQQSNSQAGSKAAQKQSSNAKLPTSIPNEQQSQSQQVANGNQPGKAQLNSGKTEVNLADNIRLGEGVWGHLPERVRRQMIASGTVKFLPKYQTLIEEYYRRVADDNAATNRKNPK